MSNEYLRNLPVPFFHSGKMKKNAAIMFLVFLLSGTLFGDDFVFVKGGKVAMRTDLMQRQNNPGCNEDACISDVVILPVAIYGQ